MSFFLAHLETIFYGIAGLITLVIGLVWRNNLIDKGYDKKEDEINEANLEAIKKGKEIEKDVKQLSDSELDAVLDKRMSKRSK